MGQSGGYFEGRMLSGKLTLVLASQTDVPDAGYAVTLFDGSLWRNGERVGHVRTLKFDRDALGWWVDYTSWKGSPMEHPAVVRDLPSRGRSDAE